MKCCDNCYWSGYRDKWCINEENQPKENICEDYDSICQECGSDRAEYLFKRKHYCSSCLLKEFEVEEATITHYYLDGECLGTDDDMGEVMANLDDDIETLGE